MSVLRSLMTGFLAGLFLASCVAHGQQQDRTAMPKLSEPPKIHLAALAGKPYWRAFRVQSSHSAAFFKSFLFGRVFVHEHVGMPGAVIGELVRKDGQVSLCIPTQTNGKHYVPGQAKLDIETHSTGAARTFTYRGDVSRSLMFYRPDMGEMYIEYLGAHSSPHKWQWKSYRSGWVQDSWPRLLADACPKIRLPPGMEINERQTAGNLEELRRQDANAPIRNFPGSEHMAPGRTGLVATGGGPTTTREEIAAFMEAQEGNILLSSLGNPYVFVGGWTEDTEIWRLAPIGEIIGFGKSERIHDPSGQEWSVSEVPGVGKFHYPVGWPLPLLPTGRRHAAFQLTDRLVEAGEPVVLPWMPAKWKDFTFLADGKVQGRRADGGPDRLGRWLWTKARLWVDFDGNREAPEWEDVAEQLGMAKPKLWKLADGQRIAGSGAMASSATSGTGHCSGEYEGTATWTLGADGKRVWDTSGCKKRSQ